MSVKSDPVPELGSLVLLGTGMSALGLVVRRKKKVNNLSALLE